MTGHPAEDWECLDRTRALRSEEIAQRAEVLRAMDTVIKHMEHEMAYEEWINYVPDEADDDELHGIAKFDVDWLFVQRQFCRIVREYGKHGWFV